MFKSKINSIQSWLPIRESFCDGIIKLKNNNLIKIIKVTPINYELKSEFEKSVILNSYKTFLKNCNFNIQIIIQSTKEDISKNIEIIKNKEINNNLIKDISNQYINYIEKQNKEKLSSSKKFFILLSSNNFQENEEKEKQELKEKYIKIKEALFKCGNIVYEIKEKKEIEKIIKEFLNKN